MRGASRQVRDRVILTGLGLGTRGQPYTHTTLKVMPEIFYGRKMHMKFPILAYTVQWH